MEEVSTEVAEAKAGYDLPYHAELSSYHHLILWGPPSTRLRGGLALSHWTIKHREYATCELLSVVLASRDPVVADMREHIYRTRGHTLRAGS